MSDPDIQSNSNTEEPFDDWDAGTSPTPVELSEAALGRPSFDALSCSPSRPGPTHSPAPLAKPQPIPMQGKLGHFPAFMSRSALFSVARLDNHSPHLPPSNVMAQGKYELEYSGPQLTMMDKAVWQAVVDIAKASALDLSEPLHTSLSEIAKRISCKSDGGRVLSAISASLERLASARIDFTLTSGHSGSGSLLLSASKVDGGTDIRLDPAFALPALGLDRQFLVNASRSRSLDSTLAQWLHDFLSTHSEERSLTLDYLRELCGFDAQKQRFPERLKSAMESLQSVAPTLVAGFDIEHIGRNSDRWRLKITRGAESVAFTDPRRSLGSAKTQPLSRSPKGPRRSGVAL